MLTPEKVKRLAMKTIGQTNSFVAASRVPVHVTESLSKSDAGVIVGIYLNGRDSHVEIAERGVTVVIPENSRFIPYTAITHLTSPDEEDRDLDLLVELGEVGDVLGCAIPVFGVTEDIPDIFAFYDFLLAIFEHLRISPINLRSVASRQDLVDFLRTECSWEEYTGALASYLERGFDTSEFERLEIDRELLNRPDFWRVLAVILDQPIRQPVDQVRDPDSWDNSPEFPK